LGHPEMSANRSRTKSIATQFLEYEYGVKPLVKDLQDSMKILTSDPGPRRIRASAKEYHSSGVQTNFGAGAYSREDVSCVLKIVLGTDIRVSNPNLWLAGRLGLIDLALPWKLIPFSFVLDWFGNVEQVISSCTDWFGCELSNQYTTTIARGTRRYISHTPWQNGTYPDGSPRWEFNRTVVDQDSVELKRTLGFSSPSFVIRPFKGFSLERGAQALSLISSVFGR
jgi:hypothetical protein